MRLCLHTTSEWNSVSFGLFAVTALIQVSLLRTTRRITRQLTLGNFPSLNCSDQWIQEFSTQQSTEKSKSRAETAEAQLATIITIKFHCNWSSSFSFFLLRLFMFILRCKWRETMPPSRSSFYAIAQQLPAGQSLIAVISLNYWSEKN